MGLFPLVLTGFRRIDAPHPPGANVELAPPHNPHLSAFSSVTRVSKARAPSCLHLQLFGVMPFLSFDR
jgi:hypothetical protein